MEELNREIDHKMTVWIINPFDQLPNETDVPLRYWTLCRVLASQGHTVTWWTSNFSHLTKAKRLPCETTDGFSIRLIQTPPYHRNISFARLRNHQQFAKNFAEDSKSAIETGKLDPPDRILISIPPLGLIESCISLRKRYGSQIIVDIQDAWPETFYRAFPKFIPNIVRSMLLGKQHRNASHAYLHADRISAVGQTYLDLAVQYGAKASQHLCYLGAEIRKDTTIPNYKQTLPLEIVYLGAMEKGYDLETVIELAALWKKTHRSPLRLHMAGSGTQLKKLRKLAQSLALSERDVIWHGYLQSEQIHKLLSRVHLGIVPNRSNSLVACPNKACVYAAAGLPIISCLEGELEELLKKWRAGTQYTEGEVDSLLSALNEYINYVELVSQIGANAHKMATALFDREVSYPKLAHFIVSE